MCERSGRLCKNVLERVIERKRSFSNNGQAERQGSAGMRMLSIGEVGMERLSLM